MLMIAMTTLIDSLVIRDHSRHSYRIDIQEILPKYRMLSFPSFIAPVNLPFP